VKLIESRRKVKTVRKLTDFMLAFAVLQAYHSRFIPEWIADLRRDLRYFSEITTFYQNDLAVRNTADVTGGKPIRPYNR
jgi:hypothetical protein